MTSLTSKITFNRATHIAAYKELFVKGKADLGSMTSMFQRKIKDLTSRQALLSDDDQVDLLKSKVILQIAIEAKKDYYKTSKWGQIAHAFQKFLKSTFGINTTTGSAKEVLNKFDTMIKNISPQQSFEEGNAFESELDTGSDLDDDTFENVSNGELVRGNARNVERKITTTLLDGYRGDTELGKKALYEAQSFMRHHFAAKTFPNVEGTLVCEPSGKVYTHSILSKNDNQPSLIRITQLNGDVLEIDIARKENGQGYVAHGAGRYIYKAMLYSNDKMPKETGVMTSFPGVLGDDLEEMLSDAAGETADTNQGIRHEKSQLQKLEGIDGIINTQDCMTLKIEGTDFVFASMDYYPLGNLEHFLNSESGQNLSVEQKMHIITLLQKIVGEIHDRGFVHRDIKTANIVIKYNSENELYEPILIDFEKTLSIKEDKRHFSATLDYWSPEYVKAGVDNLKENLDFSDNTRAVSQDVPATALDLWGLGLVCYRIWHNQNLITALGGHSAGPLNMRLNEQHKAFTEEKIAEALSDPSSPEEELAQKMIKSLLEVDPHKRAITLPIS